ncbi:phospholipid scramblase 1 isoform X1 [Bombina bombina]|uniref:phospholipid scramblase 1 isoform X1 n=1 Tax=Bombina bombina TaxID=8345 RepID=UPI00235B0909|nr:phospholipid scramblase 1 isoform X1 [Bombina bombina]XP_053574386.1 phospholipid scramblase 1 isoform X1 [Bombina bombina]
MSSTEFDNPLPKVPAEDPPSYHTVSPSVIQPTAAELEEVGNLLKGVPPGLEFFAQINQFCVREKFSVSQGWSTRTFDVLNSTGQKIYHAVQLNHICGPLIDLKIKDNSGNDVVDLIENCKCSCDRQMEVRLSQGNPIGYVHLHWNALVTHISLLNANKEVVLLIIGPNFNTVIFGSSSFEIKSKDEQHVVGMINHEAEQFIASFPNDLEVTVKAVVMGACFYLDTAIQQKRRQMQNRRKN